MSNFGQGSELMHATLPMVQWVELAKVIPSHRMILSQAVQRTIYFIIPFDAVSHFCYYYYFIIIIRFSFTGRARNDEQNLNKKKRQI